MSDEQDARRYRWLRENTMSWITLLDGFKYREYRSLNASSWDVMDAAIDAALAANEPIPYSITEAGAAALKDRK